MNDEGKHRLTQVVLRLFVCLPNMYYSYHLKCPRLCMSTGYAKETFQITQIAFQTKDKTSLCGK